MAPIDEVTDELGRPLLKSALAPALRNDTMEQAEEGPTLIFDGVCNLCNGAMHWYNDRLRGDMDVKFMWLQHPETQALLRRHNITNIHESWALIRKGQVSRGSTAWLEAVWFLKTPWWPLSYLLIFPACIREPVYNFVARNRYRFFGKAEACRMPTQSLKKKFLHDVKPLKDTSTSESLPP
ncbi:unnamed protein product [Amoebophrya sp. A25]|nr:unnamed protein product [Amoebophrya sp. A25]|eukprot:GSA25T00018951001.1